MSEGIHKSCNTNWLFTVQLIINYIEENILEYLTPEAFTKAFTRFHGFPPSFVRRTYPKMKVFNPLLIKIQIHGGWGETFDSNLLLTRTKDNSLEQVNNLTYCYDGTTNNKGGICMENGGYKYNISVKDMKQKDDWEVLLSLTKGLKHEGIKFKVDGKTMIFAHGLEFELEKICLTFKWDEEQIVKKFFHYNGKTKSSFRGFKYFDVTFQRMKVRCMFYGDCPGDDTDEFLYRNTELVNVDEEVIFVQTLEFYLENAEPNTKHYKMVEQWLKNR